MPEQSQLQKDLIEELGLSGLPEDKKEQLLLKMSEAILKRIFVETMHRLSEADQTDYEKMIDRNASPREVEEFLHEKISGYDEMVKRVIENFKEEMKRI